MLAQSERLMTLLPPSLLKRGVHGLIGLDRYIPLSIKRPILTTILQYLFRTAINDGDMDFLHDKTIKIKLSDSDTRLYIGFRHRRFELYNPRPADVCFSGKLEEFIYLAARQEDPDTLFFQRRLMIEGDTELGLELKNILDSLDYDMLPTVLQGAIQGLARRLTLASGK